MVILRSQGSRSSMAIDASGVWPAPSCRRGAVTAYKFRVREERKRVIRLSNEKYRTIDDHESGLRRFVLIKNTLRRLQREAREEKLARHRAGSNNVSPSYLSASRPRASSPPCDMQVSDVLSEYGQPTPAPLTSLEEDDPLSSPAKKLKLFHDDDKENSRDSCETRLQCEMDQKEDSRGVIDDTILRDLYETLSPDPLSSPRPGTPTPPRPDTPYSTSPYSCNLPTTTTSSLACSPGTNTTCSAAPAASTTTTFSSGAGSGSFYEWSRPQQQQQYACGHASLLGNDLQSVVFHSLIASLES
ncbi:mucin-2-like isoform X1 [Scylla paramamosain]